MPPVTPRKSLSAREIAEMLDGKLVGNPLSEISGVEIIERATPAQLTFVGDAKNLERLRKSHAAVVIAPEAVQSALGNYSSFTFVLVPEPEPAFLSIAGVLQPPRPRSRVGISPKASIHESAQIGPNTNIHPFAVIGEDVVIGHSCEIHSGVVIGNGCVLGDNVVLHPNTVLYHDVKVGSHSIIHAACVIGADGFGYRFVNGGHQRLPHYGTVVIESDVEIGAGTTIDRAKVGETVIGSGTRIDNQVMIGHNCRIGRHNLIVSQVGFAGSCSTGDYVVCAGQVGIADHVHLGTGAIVGAKAGVHRDLPGGQTYLGSPAAPVAETTRQLMALRRLPEIRDTVKQLEKTVAALCKQNTDPEASAA
jgi:UDP-3-O-[3-hydroxymyristoyl] glucosamine N-acyltransferase